MRKQVLPHFLFQVSSNLSPIGQLLFQICTFLAITIQCAHCTAMGKRKDISSLSVFQSNRNRIIRALNECVVRLNAGGALYVKGR